MQRYCEVTDTWVTIYCSPDIQMNPRRKIVKKMKGAFGGTLPMILTLQAVVLVKVAEDEIVVISSGTVCHIHLPRYLLGNGRHLDLYNNITHCISIPNLDVINLKWSVSFLCALALTSICFSIDLSADRLLTITQLMRAAQLLIWVPTRHFSAQPTVMCFNNHIVHFKFDCDTIFLTCKLPLDMKWNPCWSIEISLSIRNVFCEFWSYNRIDFVILNFLISETIWKCRCGSFSGIKIRCFDRYN